MKQRAYGYAALAMFCLGVAPVAEAELEPISEERMGEVTGQAFMNIENLPVGTTDSGHEFTRMTLNMDIETRVNIDDVVVGQIDGGADFAASDVALGHIAREGDGAQYDGVTYAAGEAVPFEAYDPYIELAVDPNEGAEGVLSGFRMGFKQARGSVSSNTTSFSGDIGLMIDDAGTLKQATLFGADNVATQKRATQVGIDDGTGNCGTCAPLSQLRSLIVGADDGSGVTGFTDDFFIGFQRESVKWQSPDRANVIEARQGVFINLPTNMTVDMSTLTGAGVPRLRTHQTDLGESLF
ncbi:hypothetical protein [Marinobacter pelagius]|uniref:Uncharacterized protein n=1 Tax=Marinobacter pelagius TaxID=379482 RepID=A0A1I4TXY8_9GAMM|nr:hypothetical protein [Marinobacter pelagius]SFM81634.1 hypothetical protein SAMN04487961_1351 [Marinobacter pelagius]